MNANDFAGSDFLKAADLGQSTPQITINKVEPVDFQDGSKPKLVIHATNPNCKPVVLNVTNTRACIAAFGLETEGWIGKTVMLSVRQTQMGPGLGVTPMQTAPEPTVAAPQLPPGQQMPGPNAMPVGPGAPQGAAFPPAAPDLPGQPGVPFDDKIPY